MGREIGGDYGEWPSAPIRSGNAGRRRADQKIYVVHKMALKKYWVNFLYSAFEMAIHAGYTDFLLGVDDGFDVDVELSFEPYNFFLGKWS